MLVENKMRKKPLLSPPKVKQHPLPRTVFYKFLYYSRLEKFLCCFTFSGLSIFILTALFTAGPTLAEPAHRHGVADLDIAFSGKKIAIELHSPAHNILGFEHAPRTDAERERLAEDLSRLKEANSLFGLPDTAGCKLESVVIDNPFEPENGPEAGHHGEYHEHDDHHGEGTAHDGDHHGNHHGAGHESGHKTDHESEHGHGHEHAAHGEQETHADICVSYRYHCQRPGWVDGIEAQGLFGHFPGFEELKARWIGDRGQSAARVTKEDSRIDF
ncbi:MAG: Protein of unknown function (DUF2796) [Candidatus Kentron sp. G]|nr:MAG: Protein of unknown function (DUF2796) [Candidatus Kentron sp. G]VFN03729.1 MAG: Protein of unknown function (DUF2796) [Candidatus Kentron sp. G]VFN06886.1 MAG: Protein of unknown function (DUF2796) [Candidatus Kentron sp. G]